MNRNDILSLVKNETFSFEEKALALYNYQLEHNSLYRKYVTLVRYNDFRPDNVRQIPFFPISLFKDRIVKTGDWDSDLIFYSSGTTKMKRSKHVIRDPKWYLKNASDIWSNQLGPLQDQIFVSLLPSYHENQSSSLLYMVQHFMKEGALKEEHYFSNDQKALQQMIEKYVGAGKKVVLFGVSFALLDYVAEYQHANAHSLMVVETGGMKKHRRDLTRVALHEELHKGFEQAQIVSEYGMTECLSQMYCTDGQNFMMNDRMQIFISDPTDPDYMLSNKLRGRINIVDLANVDSVSFIATDDLGMIHDEGSVEILGRLDNSDLRGCNYLL